MSMSMSMLMKSSNRSRAATVAALSLVVLVGTAAGCGGDGDGGGPQDAFIGRWFNESTTTGFTMTCTDPVFTASLFPAGPNQFEIFGNLTFEHGELTDLAETSGNCNLLHYDIKGNTATVANPDPYIDLDPPDNAAGCVTQFTVAVNNNPVPAFILLTPDASWTVKLLPEKTSAGADRLQLVGTAAATILIDDGSAMGVVSTPDCSYGGMDTFFRLTRP
jgi:hypothetical protein